MALDTAVYVTVQRGLTGAFDVGRKRAVLLYPLVCTEVNSQGEDEQYGFIGDVPGVREWLGDRLWRQARAGTYRIANRGWEDSMLVDRWKVDDNRLGLTPYNMMSLGMRAELHPDTLLIETIVAGETDTGWDDIAFFSTSHAWGDSGTQSNLYAANPIAGAAGAIVADDMRNFYTVAVQYMAKYKTDQGHYMNETILTRQSQILVLCPVDLQQQAIDGLLGSLKVQSSAAVENLLVTATPRVEFIPGLTNAREFYVINTAAPIRPFIFQKRERLRRQWKGVTDIESRYLKLMTEARYAMGYGPWWTCVKCKFN